VRYGAGPRAAAPNASRLIGPADWRVVAVLAGIVPTHPVIAERVAGRTHAERQLFWADWMAGVCPHLSAWMRSRQRIYGHVQDVRDFRRTLLAVDPVGDRDLAHPEILANQRRQRCHRAAHSAGEDRAQRFGLLVVSALIDIGGYRPVSVRH